MKPPDLPIVFFTFSLGGEWFWLPEVRTKRLKYSGRAALGWLYFELEFTYVMPAVWLDAKD